MKRSRKSKKKGPVRSKKASADGIDFRSGLEKNTYLALKAAGLFEMYEKEQFQVIEGFTFPNISIEKQGNGKTFKLMMENFDCFRWMLFNSNDDEFKDKLLSLTL